MDGLSEVEVKKAQDQFVEMLPDVERRARLTFRELDPDAKEEAVSEVVAHCWKNHLHCALDGKAVPASSLAHYAMLGVKSGRCFAGQSSLDVLSPRTRLLGRVTVGSLDAAPANQGLGGDGIGWWDRSEALEDRRLWERPPERVRVKHDYGAFLCNGQVSSQEELAFNLLAEGHSITEIAEHLQVSAPRVCQLKHSLAAKLLDFFGPSVCPG